MNKRSILQILAVWVSLTAAAQDRRLEPLAPEGHLEMGREYISLSNDSIRLELGFDGMFGDFFVFDAVVINQSGRTVPVEPAFFYYVILDSADAEASLLPPFRSAPPDRILRYYHERLQTRENERDMNTVFGFIEGGLNLLSNATAFLATEDPMYIVDAVLSSAGTAGYYVTTDQAIGQSMDRIREEEEVVKEEILRPGEVPPGKVLSGYVFFPEYDEPGYLMFCIPVGDQEFQFVYRQ